MAPRTNAMIGWGTFVELRPGPAGIGVWKEIAELIDVTPPNQTKDTVDATHMSSLNRIREFIGGLRDGGEASFELAFRPGSPTEDVCMDCIAAGELPLADGGTDNCGLRITFPNLAVWTCDVIGTGYEPGAPLDDKMTATFTCKVTGGITMAAPVGGWDDLQDPAP